MVNQSRFPFSILACWTVSITLILAVLATAATGIETATEQNSLDLGNLSPQEFERLQTEIKTQPGESPWRQIGWLTNLTEARKQAAAEGKPIVIFTAVNGIPLGRT